MLGQSTVASSSLFHEPKLREEGFTGTYGFCMGDLVFCRGGFRLS